MGEDDGEALHREALIEVLARLDVFGRLERVRVVLADLTEQLPPLRRELAELHVALDELMRVEL